MTKQLIYVQPGSLWQSQELNSNLLSISPVHYLKVQHLSFSLPLIILSLCLLLLLQVELNNPCFDFCQCENITEDGIFIRLLALNMNFHVGLLLKYMTCQPTLCKGIRTMQEAFSQSERVFSVLHVLK